MLDVKTIKQDFPILRKKIHGKSLVYLDNAATSHKPQQVIEAISNYYSNHNANVHRGVHTLSDESTTVFAESRDTIASFFGAQTAELILVRNTTEAINGVAYGWVDHHLEKDDVILATGMEHHSNIVVWQQACKRTGAKLEFVGLDDQGKLNLEDLRNKLKKLPVKLLALAHVSNTMGTVNPLREIVSIVGKASKNKKNKIRILVDGAQFAPHMKIEFHQLGVDFYTFSGHKMLGPMGVGCLLVRQKLLESEEMSPWLFGGGMIDTVTKAKTEFHQDLSERFVAGTPDVASAVGLATACEYLTKIGMDKVEQHDLNLVKYALKRLASVREVKLVGPLENRLGSVAFIYKNVHAHDVAQVLDSQGIAVRSGHHCTMPLHQHFGWQATVRASFQIYNTKEDIDQLIKGLEKVKKVFS